MITFYSVWATHYFPAYTEVIYIFYLRLFAWGRVAAGGQINIRVYLRSSVDLINLRVFAVNIYLSVSEFLYLMGEVPVHFLKALENALCSEKPSRKAISLMVFTGFLMY